MLGGVCQRETGAFCRAFLCAGRYGWHYEFRKENDIKNFTTTSHNARFMSEADMPRYRRHLVLHGGAEQGAAEAV